MRTRPFRHPALLAGVLALALLAAACGSSSNTGNRAGSSSTAGGDSTAGKTVTLRLGYFANVTHAPAVYGVQSGSFATDLGSNVTLRTSVFNAGPAAVEALFSGAIDATFVGPNPAISAYTKSNGAAVRVVACTASGGAFLVVQPGITTPQDLKGKKIADPQLNGTQDIALRWYLKQQGFKTDTSGGGDVKVVPQENAQTLDAFKARAIDGAWVPEPWATRLVTEGGGKVLVDERDQWPDRKFATTVLLVTTKFLKANPDTVKALIRATANAIDAIAADRSAAADVVAKGIETATSKPIKKALVTASFASITFTLDPVASSLRAVADHAAELGLNKKADLSGIFDLTLVNEVLKAEGKPEVAAS